MAPTLSEPADGFGRESRRSRPGSDGSGGGGPPHDDGSLAGRGEDAGDPISAAGGPPPMQNYAESSGYPPTTDDGRQPERPPSLRWVGPGEGAEPRRRPRRAPNAPTARRRVAPGCPRDRCASPGGGARTGDDSTGVRTADGGGTRRNRVGEKGGRTRRPHLPHRQITARAVSETGPPAASGVTTRLLLGSLARCGGPGSPPRHRPTVRRERRPSGRPRPWPRPCEPN
jgi:hypothetical protein